MAFFDKNITSSNGKWNWMQTRIHPRSVIWLLVAILAMILYQLMPTGFWDDWYYKGVFAWIRLAYDYLLGWIPIPMIYVVVSVILVRTVRWFYNWKKGALLQISKAIGGVAALVALFYVLWGFNYRQVSLQEKLGFELNEVSEEDIRREFYRASSVLKKEAEQLPANLTRDESITGMKITDHDVRDNVELALAKLQLPHSGKVRVRQLWPRGFLLRWSTAGIYIPQAGEGHIDLGLLSVQKPFSLTHEMAHGYGVTDEGACNFIAWLACSESRDPWVRFGGAFTYWRYAAAEMPYDSVAPVLNTFPPVVQRSLALIKINDKKYPDILPQVRDAIYSSYLKQHGVKSGLRSYNEVVSMVQLYLQSKSSGNQTE